MEQRHDEFNGFSGKHMRHGRWRLDPLGSPNKRSLDILTRSAMDASARRSGKRWKAGEPVLGEQRPS